MLEQGLETDLVIWIRLILNNPSREITRSKPLDRIAVYSGIEQSLYSAGARDLWRLPRPPRRRQIGARPSATPSSVSRSLSIAYRSRQPATFSNWRTGRPSAKAATGADKPARAA